MSDWQEGYMDGRDLNAPHPSDNRTEAYRHSFDVGRREIEGRVASAAAYRKRAAAIESNTQYPQIAHDD